MQDENHSNYPKYLFITDRNILFPSAAAVDFWALGICLYQCLVGSTPFADDTPPAIISNILNYRLLWPTNDDDIHLDDDAISAIKGLLNYDSTSRFQLDGKSINCIRRNKTSALKLFRSEKRSFFSNDRLGEFSQYTSSFHSCS